MTQKKLATLKAVFALVVSAVMGSLLTFFTAVLYGGISALVWVLSNREIPAPPRILAPILYGIFVLALIVPIGRWFERRSREYVPE